MGKVRTGKRDGNKSEIRKGWRPGDGESKNWDVWGGGMERDGEAGIPRSKTCTPSLRQ